LAGQESVGEIEASAKTNHTDVNGFKVTGSGRLILYFNGVRHCGVDRRQYAQSCCCG